MGDNREISIQRAEQLLGRRVDRRRQYAYVNGEVCYSAEWTRECTGCCETGEMMGLADNYPVDEKHGCLVGGGCEECGFTGKRREAMWLPCWTLELAA